MNLKIKYGQKYVVAVVLLAMVVGFNPLQAESPPREAHQALLEGNWSEVLAVLEKSDVKDTDVPCRMVAAHACLATNRNNASMLMFLSAKEDKDIELWSEWTKSLLQSNPQNPIALYLSADAEARQGKLKAAIEGFTQALNVKTDFALTLNARGVVRVLNNEWDEALIDFLQATQCDPKLADAHTNLGTYWVIREAPDGAIEAFNKAIALNPDFAMAYNGIGCANFGKGDFEKATHNFSITSRLSPILAVAEINQGYASTYASRLVALANIEKKPGTTIESIMKQYSDTLREQQIQSLKMLPSQKDRQFWGKINNLTNLSGNRLQSLVKDYSAHKVQMGAFIKMQELKSQMTIGYQKSPQTFIDKINLSNDMSSFSFYSLDLDKKVHDFLKKPLRIGVTDRLRVTSSVSPPKGHIIFCSPGVGLTGAFSTAGHIALSLGRGMVYEMPGQDEAGRIARSPRITTWDKLAQAYSSVHSVPIPGAMQNDIDRLVARAEEVVKNPTGYYSEQYNVLNHNCIQSVKHLTRDIGLDLGDPKWKISEHPWQFYTWLRIKNTESTPVRKLSQEFGNLQQQVMTAGEVHNVETKLNILSTKYTTIPTKQLTSQVPGYYTTVDRPLTEIGAVASMVDKSIARPLDGSARRALVVAQDPFRATIQQQELHRYGFETRIVPPTIDIQADAKKWGADVISGIRGTTQIEVPRLRGTSQSIQQQIKQNWEWGERFTPTYPKGSPGGISTEELARSFVDKGNWPVLTFFGLLYQTNTFTGKEGG